jgi:hypothetical protein
MRFPVAQGLSRLVANQESYFNNAMRWKKDSYNVVGGTEDGHLLLWQLESQGHQNLQVSRDSRPKGYINPESLGGIPKLWNNTMVKLHDGVTHRVSLGDRGPGRVCVVPAGDGERVSGQDAEAVGPGRGQEDRRGG